MLIIDDTSWGWPWAGGGDDGERWHRMVMYGWTSLCGVVKLDKWSSWSRLDSRRPLSASCIALRELLLMLLILINDDNATPETDASRSSRRDYFIDPFLGYVNFVIYLIWAQAAS